MPNPMPTPTPHDIEQGIDTRLAAGEPNHAVAEAERWVGAVARRPLAERSRALTALAHAQTRQERERVSLSIKTAEAAVRMSRRSGQRAVIAFAVRQATAGFTRKPAPAKPRMDVQMAERHPLRTLLAEDNVVNQRLAVRLLQQMGCRADLTNNGIEAIESIERQTHDVVLMHVQMPEMDGLEASRRITARWKPHERPRVVAMTANAMQGDREECLAAGMDDYVTKPIRVEALVEALSQTKARHVN
jgi:CheY-like chemotaxis protein